MLMLLLICSQTFNVFPVYCSRKRFSEKQAEQWWSENRARVYEHYNVRSTDKSSVGVDSELGSMITDK